MRQFGNLYCKNDPEIVRFLEEFASQGMSSGLSICKLRELVRNSENPKNRLLIYVRMFFWGYIGYDEAIEDLEKHLSAENFNAFDAFERTEIATCLGPRLTSILSGIDIFDAKYYREFPAKSNSAAEVLIEDEIWRYIPPPTGFFSVIENIVLAKFLCKLHGKTFSLDTDFHKWWRYPVGFDELFGDVFSTDFLLTKSVKYLPWNVARETISRFDINTLHTLSEFKVTEYKRIKNALQNWLSTQGEKVKISKESAVYFIRGGDKLILETMPTPTTVVETDFDYVLKKSDNFMVLSDDYALANDFADRFGASKIVNMTERKCGGYFVNDVSTRDDVRTIITNYIILSSVRYSMSCPSSNLTNSAHWSNENLISLDLKSTPLLRYVFL